MADLVYPRPRVEQYGAHRALYLLGQRPAEFNAFLEDRTAWLDRQDLRDAERELIQMLDYPGMVAAGLHPILVLTVQRKMELFGVN